MKYTIIGLALAAITLAACNGSNSSESTTTTDRKDTMQAGAADAGTTTAYTPPSGVDAKASASIKGIVDGYIKLKNALAGDDGNSAAAAGKDILAAMQNVDQSAMSADQKKAYAGVADDVKENAEHISQNAGKIDHQREHFEMLSKDVEDLVKTFGGGQKLYKDFCPMANDNKGAAWISEVKDIKNPYMGKEMPDCGEVKEELK